MKSTAKENEVKRRWKKNMAQFNNKRKDENHVKNGIENKLQKGLLKKMQIRKTFEGELSKHNKNRIRWRENKRKNNTKRWKNITKLIQKRMKNKIMKEVKETRVNKGEHRMRKRKRMIQMNV